MNSDFQKSEQANNNEEVTLFTILKPLLIGAAIVIALILLIIWLMMFIIGKIFDISVFDAFVGTLIVIFFIPAMIRHPIGMIILYPIFAFLDCIGIIDLNDKDKK